MDETGKTPTKVTIFDTQYLRTRQLAANNSMPVTEDSLVKIATKIIRRNLNVQDLHFLTKANLRITPLINTPTETDTNLIAFSDKITNNPSLRDLFFKLCYQYSNNSQKSDIYDCKENIKKNLNSDLHNFIDGVDKKTIQDLIFYPFVINNPPKIFSPDTVYFFLTYNHAKLQNARLPCLTKKDYEDFASLLVADFEKRPIGIGGNLDELRKTINDDKKFIDLLVGDNNYVLPSKETYTLERIKGLASLDKLKEDAFFRDIAESITNNLLKNNSGDDVEAPQQSAIQSGKEVLINDIYNSIKNNGYRIFQISKNGDENEYQPELEELFKNIKSKIAPNRKIDNLIEFFWIAVARLKISHDQEDSDIIITGNDQIDKGWKTLHDDFQRTQELLHNFKSVITNSSIGFFSQLERIFKEEGASSKLFQATKGIKEFFMEGCGKSIKEMKENGKANFLEAITFDNNDFLKPEFRDKLSYKKNEYIRGENKTVYTFNSNEALKVIFELAMSQYEGNLKFLDEKDLVPNHKRNNLVPEKQDLPYLIFKAFDRIFNLNAEQLLKFKNYINVYQNSTDSSSKIKRGLSWAAIILGPMLGAGTVLYNSDNTPDTLYKANPKISSQELARMPKPKQLINKVINMLPEKVEFEANGKKYSIPRNSFWIYEISGLAHNATESRLNGLINQIIKEHPEFSGKREALLQEIQDQTKLLGKILGEKTYDSDGNPQTKLMSFSLTPIKIRIPKKDGKGEEYIPVILANNYTADLSLSEDSKANVAKNNFAYSLKRLPISLANLFQENPKDHKKPEPLTPEEVAPVLEKIHNAVKEINKHP
jgi:hypothetical protein